MRAVAGVSLRGASCVCSIARAHVLSLLVRRAQHTARPSRAEQRFLSELRASQPRRLRTVLFMPASNQRALAKIPSASADAYILDLEDAVHPSDKLSARENAVAFVRRVHEERSGSPSNGPTGTLAGAYVTVRINRLDTQWGRDDLAALAGVGPAALVLPKVEHVEHVREVDWVLQRSFQADRTRLWACIETPSGVFRAPEIAGASPRLTALCAGTNDLTFELQCEVDEPTENGAPAPAPAPAAAAQPVSGAEEAVPREPLLWSLSQVVAAARMHKLAAIDGVFNRFDEASTAAFERAVRQSKRLGFDGRAVIHPRHVPLVHKVYAPSAAEVALARRIVEAFEAANSQAASAGLAVVDGRMYEGMHYQRALNVIARAE